jgi:hypothetical protein
LYSIFDAESKKLFSEADKKNKVESFAHFEKDAFFAENDTFGVFHSFRPENSFFVISSLRSIK